MTFPESTLRGNDIFSSPFKALYHIVYLFLGYPDPADFGIKMTAILPRLF